MESDIAAAVAAVVVAVAFANDYFEIHSRSWHIKRFVQREVDEAEEEPIGDCRAQHRAVVDVVAH